MSHSLSSRARLIPIFASLCLFLSAAEYAIPKPLPFMRLGLANLPIILSLTVFEKRDILLLTLLKVFGQALISGTLFSYIFLFSAVGSFASTFSMIFVFSLFEKEFRKNANCSTSAQSETARGDWSQIDENHSKAQKANARADSPSHKRRRLSFIGISLAGSLANNAAQIALSFAFIFGTNTRYVAPVLLTSGFLTGFALGSFSNLAFAKSRWLSSLQKKSGKTFPRFNSQKNQTGEVSPPLQSEAFPLPPRLGASPLKPRLQFFAAMILLALFLLNELWLPNALPLAKKTLVLWLCTALFFTFAFIKKCGKIKLMPSFFMTLSIAFFQLFSPEGKTLFSFGTFRITEGALFLGLHKSAILCGMVFLSQSAVDSRLRLPGKFGNFLQTMFAVFEELSETPFSPNPAKLIEAADERLFAVSKSLGI